MNGKDLNKQIDALKRSSMDLVRELHARKLAIPAGALLLAILAAIVLLPASSTAPPAPPTASTPGAAAPALARVAQVSIIAPSTLDDDIPLTGSADPFTGTTGYDCTRVGSGKPKTYDCQVADLKVRIVCTAGATGGGPCAETAAAGATGGGSASSGGTSTGATETTGGSGDTGTTDNSGGGGGGGGGDSTPTKTTTYTVSVSIDGKTMTGVVAGDQLPSAKSPLAVYAGTNDAHTKAVFLAADGVTVSGVPMDATFGSFSMKKGQSATLTDSSGAQHKITLKSISKVTK